MERRDLVLAVLAAAEGAIHTPVQVQKLFFLIDKRLGKRIGGPYFDFRPYFYGPFDSQVYVVLEELARSGLVEVLSNGPKRSYKLTREGQERGDKLLSTLNPADSSYIRKLSSTVRQMRFGQLVSAIYRAYPEMRKNSVFQEPE